MLIQIFHLRWLLIVTNSIEYQIVFNEFITYAGTRLIAQIGSVATCDREAESVSNDGRSTHVNEETSGY